MAKRVDVTRNYIRARLVSPKTCAVSSFRVKTLSKRKGIKATFCCPKGKFKKGRCSVATVKQSILYARAKFTKAQAKKHVKSFKS